MVSIATQRWWTVGVLSVVLGFMAFGAATSPNNFNSNRSSNVSSNSNVSSKYNNPHNWFGESVDDIWNNMSNRDRYNMASEINKSVNAARHKLDKKGVKY
ncbi:MAG: hypothetical protein U9N34_06895 [Candidatus Cloacimonadota bacterium]|nr:hypothetical protein [Candidatus Cloacimonadota bacterium]